MDISSNNQQLDIVGPQDEEPTVIGQKTPVSIFHEFCTAFNFGLPLYNKIDESGEAHQKVFRVSLTVNSLGITEVGEARTIMQAKHNAANKLMHQIKEIAATGKNLNEVQHDTLSKCNDWLKVYNNILEDSSTLELKKSAGSLTEWALTRNQDLPEYETAGVTGPPHNRKFFMICKMKGHTTQGEGKSKKIAKHDAAEKMLHIMETSYVGCVSNDINSEENVTA